MARLTEIIHQQATQVDISSQSESHKYQDFFSAQSSEILAQTELSFQQMKLTGLDNDAARLSGLPKVPPSVLVEEAFKNNEYLLSILKIDVTSQASWQLITDLLDDLLAPENFAPRGTRLGRGPSGSRQVPNLRSHRDTHTLLQPIADKYFAQSDQRLLDDLEELGERVFELSTHLRLEKLIYQQYLLKSAADIIRQQTGNNKRISQALDIVISKVIMAECVRPHYDDSYTWGYGPACVAIDGKYVLMFQNIDIDENENGSYFLQDIDDYWHISRIASTVHELFHALVLDWLGCYYLPPGVLPQRQHKDIFDDKLSDQSDNSKPPEGVRPGKRNSLQSVILEGTALSLDAVVNSAIKQGPHNHETIDAVRRGESASIRTLMKGVGSMRWSTGKYRTDFATRKDESIRYSDGVLLARHLARSGWRFDQLDILLDQIKEIIGDQDTRMIGISRRPNSKYMMIIRQLKQLKPAGLP